jgi:ADP-ribose pyrophosphatase
LSHTTKSLYEGRVVRLGLESLVLPNGKAVELEIVRHPGGAAVVAVDAQNNVCLLRQYRHAAGGWLRELPAGKLEPGEDAGLTAQRELEEEAGLRAASWHKLGEMLSTPGFCDEVIHLYLAQELQQVPPRPQEHELIEVHWLPLATAVEQIHNGEIRDAKTMLGLLLAAGRLDA